jgi:hypothetical protein
VLLFYFFYFTNYFFFVVACFVCCGRPHAKKIFTSWGIYSLTGLGSLPSFFGRSFWQVGSPNLADQSIMRIAVPRSVSQITPPAGDLSPSEKSKPIHLLPAVK